LQIKLAITQQTEILIQNNYLPPHQHDTNDIFKVVGTTLLLISDKSIFSTLKWTTFYLHYNMYRLQYNDCAADSSWQFHYKVSK